MNRKRKAEQNLTAAYPKRSGNQIEVMPVSLPRSAFAKRQPQAELAQELRIELENATGLKNGKLSKNNITPSNQINARTPALSAERNAKGHQLAPILPALNAHIIDVDSSDEDENEKDDADSEFSDAGNTRTLTFTESQYPRSWKRAREIIVNEILSQRRSTVRVQITGSSSSGKATFARYLINTLLTPPEELGLTPLESLAVLHLDPTKSGFGLPGHLTLVTISVLNANKNEVEGSQKTRLGRIEKVLQAIPVGLCGQKEEPALFLSAAHQLLQVFHSLHSNIPLIVCCPSFERESERGMDYRTIQRLTNELRAEHVCTLAHKASHIAEAIEMVREANNYGNFWELETLIPSRTLPSFPAEEIRGAAIQDYFHSQMPGGAFVDQDRLSISRRKPYAVSYSTKAAGQKPDIAGVFILGDLPFNHDFMVSRVLNGSVISIFLCDGQIGDNFFSHGAGDEIPYLTHRTGGNPDPSILLRGNSLGYGLVTSIDYGRRVLYIVTPDYIAKKLAYSSNEEIMLVHGVADSPSWAYRETLGPDTKPRYLGKSRRGMQTVKSRRFKKRL